MFLSSLARAATAKLPAAAICGAPVAQATVARYASRFLSSSTPYAVDAPDGDHDLEHIEEHMEGVNRIIDVASVTEDADAITEMHDAVFGGKTMFAVDAPDGEHDFEDLVSLQCVCCALSAVFVCRPFSCVGLVMH
jgi:hypothetical protein